MTPARRIRRIQRWLSICGEMMPGAYWVHQTRDDARNDAADRLFAAELAWLAEYATTLAEVFFVDGYTVSAPTFVCSNCQRDTPWSEGAADSHPDLCNDCWDKCSEDP